MFLDNGYFKKHHVKNKCYGNVERNSRHGHESKDTLPSYQYVMHCLYSYALLNMTKCFIYFQVVFNAEVRKNMNYYEPIAVYETWLRIFERIEAQKHEGEQNDSN